MFGKIATVALLCMHVPCNVTSQILPSEMDASFPLMKSGFAFFSCFGQQNAVEVTLCPSELRLQRLFYAFAFSLAKLFNFNLNN